MKLKDKKYTKTLHKLLAIITISNGEMKLEDIIPSTFEQALIGAAYRFRLNLPDNDREFIQIIRQKSPYYLDPSPEDILKMTGRTLDEWTTIFHKHASIVLSVLKNPSELKSLPEEIFLYLEETTYTSKEEIDTLPKQVEKLISNGFNCPSCKAHYNPTKMIHSKNAGNTYLGKTNPDKLHFVCPKCKTEFIWNIDTNTTKHNVNKSNTGCLLLLFFLSVLSISLLAALF